MNPGAPGEAPLCPGHGGGVGGLDGDGRQGVPMPSSRGSWEGPLSGLGAACCCWVRRSSLVYGAAEGPRLGPNPNALEGSQSCSLGGWGPILPGRGPSAHPWPPGLISARPLPASRVAQDPQCSFPPSRPSHASRLMPHPPGSPSSLLGLTPNGPEQHGCPCARCSRPQKTGFQGHSPPNAAWPPGHGLTFLSPHPAAPLPKAGTLLTEGWGLTWGTHRVGGPKGQRPAQPGPVAQGRAGKGLCGDVCRGRVSVQVGAQVTRVPGVGSSVSLSPATASFQNPPSPQLPAPGKVLCT